MGRKTRRHWAALYLRGLLGPGDRNSLQPMAECLGLSGHDQLQHFVASPAWDDAPLWTELARQADQMLGGACRPCAERSSRGCSRMFSHPSSALAASTASACHHASKCPGNARPSLCRH